MKILDLSLASPMSISSLVASFFISAVIVVIVATRIEGLGQDFYQENFNAWTILYIKT